MANIEKKKELEKMICSEHKKKVTIKLVNDEFSFSACCEKFKQEVNKKNVALFEKQAEDLINDAFKGI